MEYASSPAGSGVLPLNSYTLFVLDFGVAEQPYGYRGTFTREHLLATVQDQRLVDTLNRKKHGKSTDQHNKNEDKNNNKDTNDLHGGHKPEKNPDMSTYLNSSDANQLMTALQMLTDTANQKQERMRQQPQEDNSVRILDLADISQRWADDIAPGFLKSGDAVADAVSLILEHIDNSDNIDILRDMAEISPPGVARDALVRQLKQLDPQTTLANDKSTPGVFGQQELGASLDEGLCAECLVDLWVGHQR